MYILISHEECAASGETTHRTDIDINLNKHMIGFDLCSSDLWMK